MNEDAEFSIFKPAGNPVWGKGIPVVLIEAIFNDVSDVLAVDVFIRVRKINKPLLITVFTCKASMCEADVDPVRTESDVWSNCLFIENETGQPNAYVKRAEPRLRKRLSTKNIISKNRKNM